MRSIRGAGSTIVVAALLAALVAEAGEAADIWQWSPLAAEEELRDILSPEDLEPPTAGPLPDPATAPPAPDGVAAGRTAGWGSVSARGEASYSIPLELPAGTNGLAPALSLEYRHRLGGGALGAGWTIGGASAISRCPRTLAQDGEAGPVTQTRADRFCLDGVRLVVVNGVDYGATGAEYRTEHESFSRVRAFGTAGAGPAYFVVEARDGRILEYGATPDSRIDWAGSAATAREWALSRVRDRSGNAIDYAYAEDAATGGYRLVAVRYNGNVAAGVAPAHEVVLAWESRPATDRDLRYVAGAGVLKALRLQRVDVRHGATLVRRYEFGYEAAVSTTGRSRLASVRECGRDAVVCRAPTVMTWQDGMPGLGAARDAGVDLGAGSSADESKRWWNADVNADGRDDLVWAGGPATPATLRFRLGQASGALGAEVDTGVPAPRGAVPLDYDGDGAMDALTVSAAGRWLVVLGGARGLATAIDTGIAANPVDYRGADLDGDGYADLVYSEIVGIAGKVNGLQVRVRYNPRGAGFAALPVTLYEQGLEAGYPVAQGGDFLGRPGERIDLDGDGREDLMMNEQYSIARISAGQRLSERFASSVSRGVPADVNGDGCTDFAYPHALGRWQVRFSSCTVAAGPGVEIAGPAFDGAVYAAAAIDWNGDGRDDLVYADAGANWKVVESAGDSLLSVVDTGVAHGAAGSAAAADVNGDGLADLLARSGTAITLRPHTGQVPDLLVSVTDGLGARTTFGYAPLTDPRVYTREAVAAYPQRAWVDARQVVASLSVADRDVPDGAAVVAFAYRGLRYDVTGRGDLGFARRVVTARAPAGLSVEETYRQDHPFAGLPSGEVTRDASGALVREVSSAWKSLALGSGASRRDYPYVATRSASEFEPGAGAVLTSTTTVAAIDALSGQVTDRSQVVTEGPAGASPGATRTERLRHGPLLNDVAGWCLGRPQSTTVTAGHSLPGGESRTRRSALAWDATTCRPVRLQLEPGDPQWQVTIELAHDAFGNVSRRSVTGAGMTPRVATTDWGTAGRAPARTANPLGQATLVRWDESLGLPLAVTDPNGLTATLGYDAFGQPVAQVMPDGRQVTRRLRACAGDCGAHARLRLEETTTGFLGEWLGTQALDLDAFGRIVRRATRMPGGGESEETTQFDAAGRPAGRQLPAWTGGSLAGAWRYRYDGRGRLSNATLHGAGGTSERLFDYAYAGTSRTVRDAAGRTTTTVSTAWGDVVEVRDAAGTPTRYEHDAFGRLLRVRDAAGAVLADLGYNPFGLKVAHVDADLGSWTLSRNALGEVVRQRDARGQVTTFEYDLLGRTTRRTEAEGVTTWSWGAVASSHDIGRLAAITGPGYAEAYAYDGLGRLSRRSITADGTYHYDYAYDGAGRLRTLTYPASAAGFRLSLGYEYDGEQAVRIRDLSAQGRVLWELAAVDAAGNVLDESRGGAVRIFSGFSPVTGALEYRQALAGSLPLQDLSYRWDETGRLRERRDAGRGSAESFLYDRLGRLETATVDGVRDVALRYDAAGNIDWKSDVCPDANPCFSYDPQHRHGVSAAAGSRYAYDANGNMTLRRGSAISWYSYNLPAAIGDGASQSRFWYGPDRNRWKQVTSGPAGTESVVYVGSLLEKVTQDGRTRWRHYIQAPTGTAGIHLRHADGSPPRDYTLTQDHQGGVDTILDAASGAIVARLAYDPFGRRRGGPVPGLVTRDGFTGHEHLDEVGLVHMNGRVYDPAIARFLSPDPIVQSPFDRQDLNRYAYAWNDPLSVVDPTGLQEVQCLHGPHGRCQGVTVTGYRDRPPGGAAYFAWRTGYNGQAASAAERDPCGQDGSAAACEGRYDAGSPEDGEAAGVAPGAGRPADYLQGLAARLGNIGMNSAPVFWMFGVGPDYEWFAVPDSATGRQGASLGTFGYLAGGLAGAMRGAAAGAGGQALSSTAGVVRRFELPVDRVFYRAFSGDARVGAWLTPTRPRSQAWAQEALALPPWNRATHVQEVRVPRGTLVERSRASSVPEWGRTRGGAEQYRLLETIPESSFGPGSPLP